MTLHIDGFDQFAEETKLPEALGRAGYKTLGPWPVLGIGRNGTPGLACQRGAFTRDHAWLSNDFSVGCAMQFTDRGSTMWLELGGELLVVWTSPVDGWTKLNEETGNALPTKNTWYYFELTLNRTEAVARLYINNRLDITLPLTPEIVAATEVTCCFGMLAPSTYRPGVNETDNSGKFYDDIYIRDGMRYGPVVLTTRVPTSHTLVEWPFTGEQGTPSQILATMPPEPLDRFLASDVIGSKSTFLSNRGLLSGNKVVATGLLVLARKSPDLDANLRGHIVGGAGAAARSTDVPVDSTYQLKYLTFEEVPGDTPEGVRGASFGIEVAAP